MSDADAGEEAAGASTLDGLALAGLIGGELARHTRVMNRELQELHARKLLSRDQVRALRHAIADAHIVAIRAQQIARLGNGRVRQSHERLSLEQVVRNIAQERERWLKAQHVLVDLHLSDIEVIVDPGLLVSLVETALDWAASQGSKIQLWLEMRNWPEHAVLTFKIAAPILLAEEEATAPNSADDPFENNVAWCLLLQLARAMGVPVDRFHVPGQFVMQLEFPRTVRKLEGLTAIEVDVGPGAAPNSDWETGSRPLAGHRALLICDDPAVKEVVLRVCKGAGMQVDCSPTMKQAVRSCELELPNIILVDERLRDEKFDELRLDIQRHDVNFPFIEIADENNVFEVSSWVGDALSRLSRDTLSHQLVPIMAMELAKVI
ncbi:hypothetical protein [Ramlibacter albus]|uniref:Response regulatory domain-containing protein n=1 Tax=Ramlibacter albus TaxID=2079448 RepID=A0A923S517_9BURK|nr:hypothetical protein [Ramlibacter albus]MBC5764707.1 hypothetical protein [Ramlibacter albus]